MKREEDIPESSASKVSFLDQTSLLCYSLQILEYESTSRNTKQVASLINPSLMAHLRPNPTILSLHALLRSTPDNAVALLLTMSRRCPVIFLPSPSSRLAMLVLCSRLLLRMRHPLSYRGWHGVLATCIGVLRLLHVLGVRNLLLLGCCHAIVRHAAAPWHVGSLRGKWRMAVYVFRGINTTSFAVNAVLITRCWFRGIEAGLRWSVIALFVSWSSRQTWIKFLPSAFVTKGWSFGVVKVYTSPVSETTSSRTCVPVSTDNSYACSSGSARWSMMVNARLRNGSACSPFSLYRLSASRK